LHRVTSERLAEAAAIWAPRFAHLRRPLVAVLLGGSNGRLRLDGSAGEVLARACASMMRQDGVGLVVTPSRRTGPDVVAAFVEHVGSLGGWVWDGMGDNPYFGLLACADAMVVTEDSVSMISEAAATSAPVMIARLPGRSRRIAAFLTDLQAIGRVRDFAGRLDLWPVAPIDDTAAAAAELRRRLAL
jgi:mitochondrial fission protein ELM1